MYCSKVSNKVSNEHENITAFMSTEKMINSQKRFLQYVSFEENLLKTLRLENEMKHKEKKKNTARFAL